ncbi:MAG: ATPase [Candidatus Zambryskibacteria bacterium CG10_big_fil_rev_8_21_14_0_10_34_34]|uniref:ATPase n=1 Tax=Candidatus Zambryskibacteria bacterium CG10_big_fil_rev_8_21_14_0_10_34_34 TaxID=1975114 RepID=A0A2H0R2K4_9BACT|nr:MAG: ATPase [Candidatus Zambryskibacteria bacterium CG10_big_fil_rev_8_21_14_0_10_34_34]
MDKLWHTKSSEDIIKELNSSEYGISNEEALLRLKKYGLNKLPESKVPSIFAIFFSQFKSSLIYILLVAGVAIFLMGEKIDSLMIFGILVFNAIVGTIQEGKAQNTLLALKKFVETKATVLRDDKEIIIPDTEIMLGDILILQEGERVPADARIILSHSLKIDEATLTGESEPKHKISEVEQNSGEGTFQYKNIVYKGTTIVAGNGRAIVIATGQETIIGSIAKNISVIDTEIPLKNNIRYLSRLIIVAISLVSILVFFIGVMTDKPVREMFLIVISLAVSVVPEGLPIVVTLILAVGVWNMGKRNALVKKLQAVEALGQAQVIAIDKTGTLTKNELVIQQLYVGGKMFKIGGVGYEPKGEIHFDDIVVDAANHPELLLAGKIGAFCANARVMYSEENKHWQVTGDPTEAAMLVVSQKLGFHKEDLERESPIVGEIPFDYKTKYHTVLHQVEDKNFMTVVGAPEVVLDLSDKIWVAGKHREMTKGDRENLEETFYKMSSDGLRIVAFSIDPDAGKTLDSGKIKNLIFVGFFGMKDAIRKEASLAIKKAMSAGVRVVMITGDHRITAQAIAKEVGIWSDNDEVIIGKEVEEFSDIELSKKLDVVSVFARVNPEHKMRIIDAYRARGEVVAMTGDGVNDAPSLVAADLGVAMGIMGTEVAKEAADIVLLDDNLESIVSAIEEGRSIYKTIKKVILYLFAGSWGQIFVIVGSLSLGFPIPLLPAHIIWLNFVTDGFLDVSLAMDPKEKHLLSGKFEKPKKYLIDKLMTKRVFLMSLVTALGALYLFSTYYENNLAKAWTISLTVLAVFHWLNVWNCRSEDRSIFTMNPFSNMYLVGATVLVIFLQMAAIYTPLMQKILRTVPLELSDWISIIPIALLIVLAEEIRKVFARHKKLKIAV